MNTSVARCVKWSVSTAEYILGALERFARRRGADDVAMLLMKNVAWTTGALAFERGLSLIQALYVARLLGVELFGKYGLLFSTVGIISGLAGLQLGLTASVHISRYRGADQEKAAAVMRLCEAVSFGLALLATLLLAAQPALVASLLFNSSQDADVMAAGAAIALLSVLGGVQEGILQGFEEFRKLTIVRVTVAVSNLLLLLLIARPHDLFSVVVATIGGAGLRVTMLFLFKEQTLRRHRLRTNMAAMWRVRHVIMNFSVPSLLTSLTGLSSWYGMLILGKSAEGFKMLGYVTAGTQWRGTVLFVTSVLATVAIPMMSRMLGQGDTAGVNRLHNINLRLNLFTGLVIVALTSLLSPLILQAYGSGFSEGRLPFILIVASTAPAAYANVFLQYLVSSGRMWETLAWQAGQNALLLVLLVIVVPTFGVVGFSLATLLVAAVFAVVIHLCLVDQISGAIRKNANSEA